MSASKFYSPLRVEADQKEVIIAHLKEEIYHLRKNEQEFYNLENQYRQLEAKYKALAHEKVPSDGCRRKGTRTTTADTSRPSKASAR